MLTGRPPDKTNDFITSRFLGPARRLGRDGFGPAGPEADKPDIGTAAPLIVDIYLRNTGGKCPRSRPTVLDRPLRSRYVGQNQI